MIEYSYSQFCEDIKLLAKEIKKYNPDCLIPIGRGGLTLGHFLGEELDIRDVVAVNAIHYNKDKKLKDVKVFHIPDLSSYKKAVLVDDISDSGDTLEEVLKLLKSRYSDVEIKVATIFYKPTSKVIPDFKLKEANEWVQFFWEKML
jgi:xanthine phosphoribosyltransferase